MTIYRSSALWLSVAVLCCSWTQTLALLRQLIPSRRTADLVGARHCFDAAGRISRNSVTLWHGRVAALAALSSSSSSPPSPPPPPSPLRPSSSSSASTSSDDLSFGERSSGAEDLPPSFSPAATDGFENDADVDAATNAGAMRRAGSYAQAVATVVAESLFWKRRARPVVTKAFSSALGFLLGDMIAQVMSRKGPFNVARWVRMGAFGGLVHGPSGHAVYGWLERSFPGSSRGAVVKKVLVDQVAWSPVSTLLLFCFTGVTGGLAPRDICRAVSRSGVGVLLSAWLIWPLAHALNFAVVPARHRLLYVNVVQIMFNTILSFLVN